MLISLPLIEQATILKAQDKQKSLAESLRRIKVVRTVVTIPTETFNLFDRKIFAQQNFISHHVSCSQLGSFTCLVLENQKLTNFRLFLAGETVT